MVIFQSPARRVPLEPRRDDLASRPAPGPDQPQSAGTTTPATKPLTVLIVVPSLHAGAADAGTVQLVRILTAGGHRPIVVASGGRMVPDIAPAKIRRSCFGTRSPSRSLRASGAVT